MFRVWSTCAIVLTGRPTRLPEGAENGGGATRNKVSLTVISSRILFFPTYPETSRDSTVHTYLPTAVVCRHEKEKGKKELAN